MMESTDSSAGPQQPNLPPGFRFHPTDEELVVHYLKKKANSAPLPVSIIAEVDLYKFDPWELPAKASFGEQEWYFFSPRERKYPNGARPNRAATSGYWKATGTDKPVLASGGSNQKVGVKKALVFYGGKPPKGIKTNWIMHEYRLADNKPNINKPPGYDLANKKNSLKLDDWVLCRIYKKNNNSHRAMDQEGGREDSMEDMIGGGGGGGSSFIPQSMRLSNEYHPKLGINYTTFLENDQNFLQGIVAAAAANHNHNNDNDENDGGGSGGGGGVLLNNGGATGPSKRAPASLFWSEEQEDQHHQSGISSNKRLHFDPPSSSISITNNTHTNDINDPQNSTSSFATLLTNLPQTSSSSPPPLHHHAHPVLGSIADGLFRPTYQIPGANWYS